jgi:type VI protein secretion system component Hcp
MKTTLSFSRKWRLQVCAWAAAGLGVLLGSTTASAIDCYMKIDTIPGEITAGPYTGWSAAHQIGCDFHTVPATATTPASTSLRFSVSKPLDRTSPELFGRQASNAMLPRVAFSFAENGGQFLRIVLTNASIAEISLSGEGSTMTETVQFNYQKIEWSVRDHDDNGGGVTGTQETAAGGTTAFKNRVPFRASAGQSANGLQISFPVEAGHRYRIRSSATLEGGWSTLHEFTAEADGTFEGSVPLSGAKLFLRAEELD